MRISVVDLVAAERIATALGSSWQPLSSDFPTSRSTIPMRIAGPIIIAELTRLAEEHKKAMVPGKPQLDERIK